jgi:hypothetical protein
MNCIEKLAGIVKGVEDLVNVTITDHSMELT